MLEKSVVGEAGVAQRGDFSVFLKSAGETAPFESIELFSASPSPSLPEVER